MSRKAPYVFRIRKFTNARPSSADLQAKTSNSKSTLEETSIPVHLKHSKYW